MAFPLPMNDVPAVLEICRRLDGIPLALELAAARVDAFGVRDLAAHLDDRFHVLTSGRRTALPRHQTLGAALDWSYQLLPEEELAVLRRLSIFAGEFALEAAVAVAVDSHPSDSDIVDHIANLVCKSLIAADPHGEVARYRLLDTTRLYAFEKLKRSGDSNKLPDVMPNIIWRFSRLPTPRVRHGRKQSGYGRHLDNVRAALDWAFSPEGDPQIGVALTVAAVPLWVQVSLLGECRERAERALARLNPSACRDRRREMQLHAAMGMSLNYTTGPVSETAAAWTNTLIIARSLDDTDYQLRALRGLWAHHMNRGGYRQALAFAHEFRDLATMSADFASLDFGDRMAAIILHYLGDQERARGHLECHFARPTNPVRYSNTTRFLLDQDVTVQALLARIFWLQRFSDQAVHTARLAVDRALAIDHTLSLCHALAQAMCPLALYTGDLACAEDSVAMLIDNARERGLAGWIARGNCFFGIVMIAREDFATGLPLLRDSLAELHEKGAAPSYPAFLAILAGCLGRAGQGAEGLVAIDQALTLSRGHEEYWCLPELLRVKGELTIMEGAGDTAPAAEENFLHALDWARRQRALAWELRVATSLARLWRDQRRVVEARELLASVSVRFTEGFTTADLQQAKNLLEQLG